MSSTRGSKRVLTLSRARANGLGYDRQRKADRFVVVHSVRIPNNIKAELSKILIKDNEPRINNTVRKSRKNNFIFIAKNTIGITRAEVISIATLIINSTKLKGLKAASRKMSKHRPAWNNENANVSAITSRELLKKISQTDLIILHSLEYYENCVLFIEGVLNEPRNFIDGNAFSIKLRLMDSVEKVSDAEVQRALNEVLGSETEA